MKRVHWRRLVALLAVLALVAAACGDDEGGDDETTTTAAETTTTTSGDGDTTTTTAAETTTTTESMMACEASIGFMGPITGPAASIGQEQLNWATFAIDRFNEENGTDFALVEGDTMIDPAQGAIIAPQFVSDQSIVVTVGPAGSQVVEAVGPIFTPAGMPFISMSATRTSLTDGSLPTFFRVVPTDADQGPTNANFMIELGAQKVFVVDDQTSYSTGLAEEVVATLEEAGVEVLTDSVNQDQTDFSSLVATVPDDTDFVYLPWQLAVNAQIFGQQMIEQGKSATIFGSDGLFAPDDFSIEGSYVSSFAPDITGIPEDAELVAAYNDEYGEFGTFGPPTYAAAVVAAEAILSVCEAGETPSRENVLAAVAATDQATSILGQPIRFTDSGDVEGAVFFIFQIVDGSYQLVVE